MTNPLTAFTLILIHLTIFSTQVQSGTLPGRYQQLLNEKTADIPFGIKQKQQRNSYQVNEAKPEEAENCVDGSAGVYPCQNIDLLSRIPLEEFSSQPSSANDIWGHTDLNDNREYAIIGLNNGTAIIDVTDPSAPLEVVTIAGSPSIWRDIKVYQCQDDSSGEFKAWAYVSTEASQGLQVIDLSGLPASATLVTTSTDVTTAHNIYIANIDYSTNAALADSEPFLYVAGANGLGEAYRVLSLADPAAPELVSKAPAGTDSVHDVTSMVITDSRTEQCVAGSNPCELLINFNDNTVDIWDMTDKTSPTKLSSTSYTNNRLAHAGWWSADQQFIFVQDELDELQLGLNTTLRTLDISDLNDPKITGTWTGAERSIDHNGFTKGDRYYMSNYASGLTVLDVSDPNEIINSGFFDTFVLSDQNTAAFEGAWGVYPYFASGNLIVSDIESGLFVLKDNTAPAGFTAATNIASCSAFSSGGGSGGGDSGGGNNGGGGNTGSPLPPQNTSGGGGALSLLFVALVAGLRRRQY